MRILVVEDDKIIGDGIHQGLQLENYAVDWVEDVESAKTALKLTAYDLLLLDLGLPDGSGFDVLTWLRKRKNDMPVLILTAYDDVSFKIKGLDSGADDYLIKPFDLNELLARVRALHRRAGGRSTPEIQVGDITMDPAAHSVTQNGQLIALGPKEFAILRVLLERTGRIVSKQQIEESLYGWDMDIESNTVEVHIHGIRRKLGKEVIKTIRHVGYQIAE